MTQNQNRRNWLTKVGLTVAGIGLSMAKAFASPAQAKEGLAFGAVEKDLSELKIGAFSVSLSVKDLNASKQFYEHLGFKVFAGDMKQNYLIMKNGNALIGLFYGMFQGNILTFNPGWDENAKNMERFNDVREIQKELKAKGIKVDKDIDPNTSGPAGFMTTDPDGNVILFDQHR
jgi:catechol 2,3-dioxygenase-like lactoylglutathione lyase family enzyme